MTPPLESCGKTKRHGKGIAKGAIKNDLLGFFFKGDVRRVSSISLSMDTENTSYKLADSGFGCLGCYVNIDGRLCFRVDRCFGVGRFFGEVVGSLLAPCPAG